MLIFLFLIYFDRALILCGARLFIIFKMRYYFSSSSCCATRRIESCMMNQTTDQKSLKYRECGFCNVL